ncbi:MAG TPA: zinc-ribbon domain-containing protein, partial [Phycisphaerales bacterium]|nr:zinc-ribbon domain-containing protein [Phycisphaerales bacterium]
MNPKPDEHEPIPLQPDAGPAALRPGREPGASAGRADPAPPILELASEPCPRCGAAIEPGETECLSCGYELRPAPPQPP